MRVNASMIAFVALAVAASFTLASCKGDGDRPEAPSTREVIRTYTKTLSTAPDKARDAAEAAKQRDNAQGEALKGL